MKCPRCESTSYRKNGRRNGKQNYLCKICGKQFLEPTPPLLETDLIANSNGHSKQTMAEASEIALAEKLPLEKFTETSLSSFSSILAEELRRILLSPDSLESDTLNQFIQRFQQKHKIKHHLEAKTSLLLLDAENLKLDINCELFLASICEYPLQVKLAFANWRNPSIGKQDIELYKRGYQLIHVPGGKDSADAKMIGFGASVLRSYPTVKEILVCSGDGILIHLCNELQNQGLIVYWVRRQGQTLHVENRNTGNLTHYSITMAREIPSLEQVVEEIQDLIKNEQNSINTRLQTLATIATLFEERRNLNTNIHQNRPEIEEVINSTDELSAQSINVKQEEQENFIQIGDRETLDKFLLKIIRDFQINSPKTKLSVSKLGTEIQKITGESPTSIVKKLKLGSSLTKYLESSPTFILKPSGNEYEVMPRSLE
ncbi:MULTISPECIES: NYN domain-containing protein [Nostoc]|uniref:NYN domain-containing protein n=1 Tax=Nostoc paludosum FACHB-159 TaxID=2692908 RepID=A0ABR8JZP7_9NOSO|nr:NYN domain-containing protein [Nostoc sp. FACHB-857]MBD2732303.1 NYN domain-containing protein [Nostoc paludosum FACHB-159]